MLAETLSLWAIVLLLVLPICIYLFLWHFQINVILPRGKFELVAANAIFLLAYNSITFNIIYIFFILFSLFASVDIYGDAIFAGVLYTYTHASLSLIASHNPFFALMPIFVLGNGALRYYEWKKEQQQKKRIAKRNVATFANNSSAQTLESKKSFWQFTL